MKSSNEAKTLASSQNPTSDDSVLTSGQTDKWKSGLPSRRTESWVLITSAKLPELERR